MESSLPTAKQTRGASFSLRRLVKFRGIVEFAGTIIKCWACNQADVSKALCIEGWGHKLFDGIQIRVCVCCRSVVY